MRSGLQMTLICCDSKEWVEEHLKRWRLGLKERGMTVSTSKEENVC